ncbi:hypothetical protein ACO0R3_001308 [Hanseniaspora guilliermondii]
MSIISKIKSIFKSSSAPAKKASTPTKAAAPAKKTTPAAKPVEKKTPAPAAAVNPKEVETLLAAIKERRTIYSLKPELPEGVTLSDIKDITQAILKDTPSAFNSQPNKVIILTGEAHKKVWNQVVDAIPTEDGKKRPQSAADEAYGTILFLIDDAVTKSLQEGFPDWAAAFPDFAVTSNGAVQISTWNALSQLPGFGAHLQHYNFLKGFLGDKIGENYTVQAQLVFGTKVAEAGEKTYNDNTIPVVTEL